MNTPNTGGFNFGESKAPTGTPVLTGTSSGFSFNSSGLGGSTTTTASGGFSFGNTAAKPATSAPFGQGLAAAVSGSFNAAQPQAVNPLLSTRAAPTASSGFSFGLTSQPSTGGLVVGTPKPTPTTSLGISNAAQPSGSTSFNFPSASTNAPASAASSTGSFTFAKPIAISGTATGLSLGTPLTSSTASSTSSGFGLPSAAVTTSLSGLASSAAGGFKFPTAGTTSSSSLFNSSSASSTPVATSSAGLGGPAPPACGVGLGGTVTSSTSAGPTGSLSKIEGKSAKESQLPQEIFSTIAEFTKYKEAEKKASEENARQTATSFHKLGDDAKKMKQHILKLSNQHTKLHLNATRLKSSVAQEAENVEMARRTHETAANLQGANKAPEEFFVRLVRSFEERMTNSRKKIEEVERCFNISNNGNLNMPPETDVMEILRKEHETVKMLAARIYEVHTQLLELHKNSGKTDGPTPEPLFKPVQQEPIQGFNQLESSILRPCLGDINSGLQNFQNGQVRAKAMSLSATPPVVPLTQSSSFLGSGQSSIMGSSLGFGTSNTSFNTSNTSFNLGNKSTFGTNFGQSTLGQSSNIGFGTSFNTSGFGVKPLGK